MFILINKQYTKCSWQHRNLHMSWFLVSTHTFCSVSMPVNMDWNWKIMIKNVKIWQGTIITIVVKYKFWMEGIPLISIVFTYTQGCSTLIAVTSTQGISIIFIALSSTQVFCFTFFFHYPDFLATLVPRGFDLHFLFSLVPSGLTYIYCFHRDPGVFYIIALTGSHAHKRIIY